MRSNTGPAKPSLELNQTARFDRRSPAYSGPLMVSVPDGHEVDVKHADGRVETFRADGQIPRNSRMTAFRKIDPGPDCD
jgi:hypothetical protein